MYSVEYYLSKEAMILEVIAQKKKKKKRSDVMMWGGARVPGEATKYVER